jgi:hypothetical protein
MASALHYGDTQPHAAANGSAYSTDTCQWNNDENLASTGRFFTISFD